VPGSTAQTLGAGSYSYRATYNGNGNYTTATGACEPFKVSKAQLSVTSHVHDASDADKTNGSVALYSIMHDQASLVGTVSGFTAPAITFTFYTSGDCTTGGSAVSNVGSDPSGGVRSAATSALNAGSYSYKASVAGNTNYVGNDSDCEPFTVNKATLTVTANNQTAPYSDPSPTLTFMYTGFKNSDGPADIDTPPTCSTTAVTAGRVTSPAGSYPIACSLGADNNYTFIYVNGTFTVTKEVAAVINIGPTSPISTTTGSAAVPITGTVQEELDGNVSGTLSGGNLAAYGATNVTFVLTPVGSGSGGSCTDSNGATPQGQSSGPVNCTTSPLGVNVYDVVATIDSPYFTGSGESVVTIYNPTDGFTTGGGTFTYNGVRVDFGFNAKTLKSGQAQGSVLTIFHYATGNYVVKSNSMNPVAISPIPGTTPTLYSATLTGKATYAVPPWDPPLSPWCPADRKCGNYSFTVYVEDRKEPGAGYDKYWIEVKDPGGAVVGMVSMSRSAGQAVPVVISGGNIQVPQPQSSTK
jgi:hypothetical protein